jgi:hypothetical protein
LREKVIDGFLIGKIAFLVTIDDKGGETKMEEIRNENGLPVGTGY